MGACTTHVHAHAHTHTQTQTHTQTHTHRHTHTACMHTHIACMHTHTYCVTDHLLTSRLLMHTYPAAVYCNIAHTQQTAAQPMVSDKPNSTPSSTSFQQPPSKSTHKQPPALLPKPKKVADTKGPPSAGSPVTQRGVDASIKNMQSDLAQPGTVAAQPTSPLMQVHTVAPGQQSPVPQPRTGHKASPTPKPRRPRSELTASQQVNGT